MNSYPRTLEEFESLVAEIEQEPGYERPLAFALGFQYHGTVVYPFVNVKDNYKSFAILFHVSELIGGNFISLNKKQLTEAICCFQYFENDGKKHSNIEAMKGILELCKADDEVKPFVTYVTSKSDFDNFRNNNPKMSLFKTMVYAMNRLSRTEEQVRKTLSMLT